MSAAILCIAILGLVTAALLYLLLAPVRAQRRERREILATGQPAVGTIVAIDVSSQGRGGITLPIRRRHGMGLRRATWAKGQMGTKPRNTAAAAH